MLPSKKVLFLAIAATVLTVVITYTSTKKNNCVEEFTAPGLTLTSPPQWWFPQKPYDPKDWLVNVYPDQISQPNCLTYNRGPAGQLNFNSYAYQYWDRIVPFTESYISQKPTTYGVPMSWNY